MTAGLRPAPHPHASGGRAVGRLRGPGPGGRDGQWSSGCTRHARAITRLPLPAYLT